MGESGNKRFADQLARLPLSPILRFNPIEWSFLLMNVTVLQSPKPMAQGHTPDLATQLANALGVETIARRAGEILYTPEQPVERVYGVRSGRLTIKNEDGLVLAQIEAGGCVGALESWTGRNWGFTVQVVADSELITLPAATFRELVRIQPALRHTVSEGVTRLMRLAQLATVLRQALGPLEPRLFEAVAQGVQWRQLDSGTVLMQQADWVDQLFLVVSGRLQCLYQGTDEIERVVGQVEPGKTQGVFLEHAPHPVMVRAVRETTVVEFPASLCQQLWEAFPHALLPFLRQAGEQQRTLLAALHAKPKPPTTLALIPASAAIPIDEFAVALAKAMEPFGTSLTLNRAQVDAHFGQKRVADIPAQHPLHPLLVDWLNEQETTYDHILYVGDATWSEWTRRCLRQADRILIVANAGVDPAPTLVEQAVYALPTAASTELVLLHLPTVERPQGTAAWLAQRPVQTHYHVRRGDPVHMARLARRLTGNALGIVLAGGGASGFVHLGLLRALEELGLDYDCVGGTSMGALAGMAYALDWSYATGVERSAHFANPKALFDYTLPLVSLFSSDKVTAMILAQAGDQQIEDLWRPYFAISTDLTAAELVVHDRGPLWLAVRASLSIPGVFAPMIDERGHLLVDGGVMNNLPADVMRARLGGGTIIGMTAGGEAEENKRYNYGSSLSGWQVLRSRWAAPGERIEAPSLPEILFRTMMVNNQQVVRNNRQACDLLIEPPVQDVGLLQFTEYARIADVGYRAALPQLKAMRVPGND
jgi:predicted acylesterase/phospholipase RssA/CRP-like cAMP-binding protein